MFILLLLVLALLFPPAAGAAGGVGTGDTVSWEQFQKDVFNSGLTVGPALTVAPVVGWRQQVDYATKMAAGVNVTPVIAEGRVFVLGALGNAWAFEAKTGKKVWQTELSSASRTFEFQLATPAYGEGRLFVATNDGHVYALAAGSGKILWNKEIAGPYDQLNTPVKYAGGKVYVGSWRNKTYYCLNASSGEVVWRRESTSGGGYYWAGACVVGEYLVYSDEAAVLTCVNKDTGQLVAEKKLKEITPEAKLIHSSITYHPETKRVFFTDEGGHCWAFDFDFQTGKLTYAWHKKLGRISTSTPAVYNGRVYVGTGTYAVAGKLYCLKEATGDTVWEFTPAGEGECEYSFPGIQASPSLSIQDGGVYIYFITICERGTAYCLDENGKKLWSFTGFEAGTPQGYGTSSVAIADGRVYFGNDGGWVYALTTAGKTPPSAEADKDQASLPSPEDQQSQQPAPETKKPSFSDLPPDHWAREVIEEMTARGIFKGYPDGTCRPDQVVGRAEFVSLLLRTLGLKEDEGAAIDFNDIQPGKWYYHAVATACRYGLAKGYAVAVEEEQDPGGQAERKQYFRPGDPVTREQVAAMLVRALEFKENKSEELSAAKVAEALARFNDRGEISPWAEKAIAAAVSLEIVKGYPGNLFKPRAGATRAEVAAMLRVLL
jgi:outer membrane protein assembly factor BamB